VSNVSAGDLRRFFLLRDVLVEFEDSDDTSDNCRKHSLLGTAMHPLLQTNSLNPGQREDRLLKAHFSITPVDDSV
jgi:hypothetical protein